MTDHIDTMKQLYNSFADDLKPEWINLEKIKEYEKEMKASKQNNEKIFN